MVDQPKKPEGSKSGLKPGSTPNTDASRKGDRPVEDNDMFGGAERTGKNDTHSDKAKP